jgi:hypothetical protein
MLAVTSGSPLSNKVRCPALEICVQAPIWEPVPDPGPSGVRCRRERDVGSYFDICAGPQERPLIQDIFAWLLATFVIGPVQAEFATKMRAAQAPAAIVQQVQGCVVNATPILINRATNDMFWGVTTTISVATGLTDARTVLSQSSPECAAAMNAVRPFIS